MSVGKNFGFFILEIMNCFKFLNIQLLCLYWDIPHPPPQKTDACYFLSNCLLGEGNHVIHIQRLWMKHNIFSKMSHSLLGIMFLCLSALPGFDVSKLSLLSPVLQALQQEDKMWPPKVKGIIFNLVLQHSSTGETWKFRGKQNVQSVSSEPYFNE